MVGQKNLELFKMSKDSLTIKQQREEVGNSNTTNKKALRKINAYTIDVSKSAGAANGITTGTAPGKSEALPEDPFESLASQNRIITPPFDLLVLSMMSESSSELGQCIESMGVNIHGTGHRFVSRLRMDEIVPTSSEHGESQGKISAAQLSIADKAREERVRLINFFTYATAESFVEFRRKLSTDLEHTGNAYFEVIRNAANEIQGFTHIPSYQMRLGKVEDEQLEVERNIIELQTDGSVQIKKQRIIKRFRKYVQSRVTSTARTNASVVGYKVVWFKEFGDPRLISKLDGMEKNNLLDSERANEIIHLKIYCPRSPYGLPRYIGNLLAIFGDRASEEINWITFKNNNVPSMIIAVSNGYLTQGTLDRIKDFVESQVKGSDNYSKFLIIEAEGTDEDGEDGGHVRIDVKPLTANQQDDAMFQNYSKENQDRIRRAFRLPPILIGDTKAYSKSVAESSRKIADEQIFKPERDGFDELINRIIFPEMGIVYHKFRSNTPNTTDNTQLVKILGGAERTGGITPRIARFIIEDILGVTLPEFPDDFPADIPFSLTMAEAVKNQADPTQPGQQVTALKTLKTLGMIDENDEFTTNSLNIEDIDEEDPESLLAVAQKLLSLNNAAETLWRSQSD